MVAHGSSDNAASYGVYAFGLLAGQTAIRDSISLTVYYGAKLDFARSTVIALSQSGRTPDVLEYVTRAAAPAPSRSRSRTTSGRRWQRPPTRCSRSRPAPSTRSPRRRRT